MACIIDSFLRARAIDETATGWLMREEQARPHHHDWALAEHTMGSGMHSMVFGRSPKEAMPPCESPLALLSV